MARQKQIDAAGLPAIILKMESQMAAAGGAGVRFTDICWSVGRIQVHGKLPERRMKVQKV